MKWHHASGTLDQGLDVAGNSPLVWISFWCLFSALGVACALLVLKPLIGIGLITAIFGCCIVTFLFAATLNGKVEPVILTWVLIFPLGYYFLTFPPRRAIVTLDRVLVMVLLLAIAFAPRHLSQRLPIALRRFAMVWIAFVVVALASLIHASDIFASGKMWLEAFCMPMILGWVVIGNFNVERNAATLHLLSSLMAIYVACIGVAEIVLKQDLLPLPGSELLTAGSLPRPNGPFYTNDAFALIGLITFFLLLFLRNLLGEKLSFWRQVLHDIGLVSSLAMAVMPMFRSDVIALMVILVIATLSERRPSKRLAGSALFVLCLLAVLLFRILVPDAYSDRSRPENVYGRLAQQIQTWQVFSGHPILGVGLGNFTEVVAGDTRYYWFYSNIRSVDSPHNTLGGILAETGILGFIPYVSAQVILLLTFWRLRAERSPNKRLAWTYFLYIFLGYWIHGMGETSGYLSDVNLWFAFSIAIVYKYSMTAEVSSGNPVATRRAVAQEFAY